MNNLMIEIRDRSNTLHKAAESTGFTRRLLDKNATKESYAEYLFNLYYVYEVIENNLDKFNDLEAVSPFVTKELYRSHLIKKDLETLLGDTSSLKPLSSTLSYVDRINSVSTQNPNLIIAHAYTRFLADLFGGRTFYSLLKDFYNVTEDGLNYYQYKDLGDMRAYVMNYHNMLNSLKLSNEEKEAFILEICNSYIYNMAISNELDAKCF
ncbi:heme oxygenase (biliverdin-producing) [Clostridium sp. MB05]|jgi:heme oxygenase (biliverdin-producing, ferredoxin)|uniref:biliverdin-producing heme oxygenase n=1 Tax=Clostridium sp. MB05 TaxID=3376682 RepID=UPI003981FC0B